MFEIGVREDRERETIHTPLRTRRRKVKTLIEYALLAGFISLVAVVAITNVGSGVNTVYGNVQAQVAQIPGGS